MVAMVKSSKLFHGYDVVFFGKRVAAISCLVPVLVVGMCSAGDLVITKRV